MNTNNEPQEFVLLKKENARNIILKNNKNIK